jgi:RNA polymerase sigma-70 factor, ECF subfamily
MPDSSSFKSNEDIELVKCAKKGDVYAFDTLCRYYSPLLCTFLARMMGSDEDGREIAQDALLTAWMKLPTLKEDVYFQTWLYRIAINLALNHLQRTKRFRWLSWEEHEKLNITNDEYVSMISLEDRVVEAELVKLALEHVSPLYRACMLLQIVADLPQRRIAQILEIDVKNVSTNVKRGMDQFRKAYELLERELDIPVKGEQINARPDTL